MIRASYALAHLEVSKATYEEIANKLRDAGYTHALCENGTIDLNGIGITRPMPKPDVAPRLCTICYKAEDEPHPYRHLPNYQEVV